MWQAVRSQALAAEMRDELKDLVNLRDQELKLAHLKIRRLTTQLDDERTAAVEAYKTLEDKLLPAIEEEERRLKHSVEVVEPQLRAEINRLEEVNAMTAEELNTVEKQKTEALSSAAQMKEVVAAAKAEAVNLNTKVDGIINENIRLEAELKKSQDSYATSYNLGFDMARRLCFHLQPDLNWDQAEEWASDPNDPHIKFPSDTEVEYRRREKEREEEDRIAAEAEERQRKAQSTQAVSSSANPENLKSDGAPAEDPKDVDA